MNTTTKKKGIRVGGGARVARKTKAPIKTVQVVTPRKTVDPRVAAHAKLLMDPCNAPLVHPCYGGSNSGYLIRLRTTIPLLTNASNTAFYCQVNPGAFWRGNVADQPQFWNNHEATGAGVGGLVGGARGDYFFSGLASMAEAVRPVAACLKIIYSGTELDRSGQIGVGCFPTGPLVVKDQTITVNQMVPLMQDLQRTGTVPHEVKMIPTNESANMTMNYTGTGTVDIHSTGDTCLAACGWGITATSEITAEVTVVYEWAPAKDKGMMLPISRPAGGTLAEVLNYLGDGAWWITKKYGPTLLSLAASRLTNVVGAALSI